MIWISQMVMNAVQTLACPLGCVKHAAIAKHTGLSGRQVANACAMLERHSYLEREKFSDARVKPGCYRLTALGLAAWEEGARLTSGPKAAHGKPRMQVDSQRDRAWRTLRIRRKVSVPELLGLLCDADTDEAQTQRAANNLQKYLRYLSRAGYLAEMRREAPETKTSNGAKRFLLVRDTGPLPPVPQLSRNRVFDQNEKIHYDFDQ